MHGFQSAFGELAQVLHAGRVLVIESLIHAAI
jgi:hypothetical protein